MSRTNKLYASLLGVEEIQRLNLRLMELASFNEFDGPKVVKSLLDHKDLWQACLMDREAMCTGAVEHAIIPVTISLIKLRDMGHAQKKRLGTITWNVDTLFILPRSKKKTQEKLFKLAKEWKPDEIGWILNPRAGQLLGGARIGIGPTKILRVWWD